MSLGKSDLVRPGSIILLSFPLTSAAESKQRPCVVVAREASTSGRAQEDWVLTCQISSAENRIADLTVGDLLIEHYARAGLLRRSVVHTRRLFTTQAKFALKHVGAISAAELEVVRSEIVAFATGH